MQNGPLRWKLASAFTALTVFALGLASLFHASPTRALWHDESFGLIASVRNVSWGELWWKGAPGQGSPHPLYYLWEKGLLSFWGPAPQRYWNLFFYFRLTPIFFYSVTGALVFLASRRALLRALPAAGEAARFLLALALALFFLKIQFAEYYALEARPYSMWLFLSAAHLFLTLARIPHGFRSRKEKLSFAALSALLCMVASPGMFQVGLSFLAIAFPRRALRDAWTILPSLAVATLYVRDVGHSGYDTGDFLYYLNSLKEVAYKSFHARNGWVFFPLFFLGAAKLARLPDRDCRRRLGGYLAGLIALSLLLYVMCLWKGFFLASRQYIYLVPAFELVYFCALWFAAEGLARVPLLGRRIGAAHWLTLWALFIIVQTLPELFHRAATLPGALSRFHAYGENLGAPCLRPLTDFGSREEQFEEVNRACR